MNPFDFIKTKEKEIIAFIQGLVKTPSQNGINPESKIAKIVNARLKRFGFKPILVGNKNRPSIVLFRVNPRVYQRFSVITG